MKVSVKVAGLPGGGATVLLMVAFPLWSEFRVSGNLAWNTFLAVFLVNWWLPPSYFSDTSVSTLPR